MVSLERVIRYLQSALDKSFNLFFQCFRATVSALVSLFPPYFGPTPILFPSGITDRKVDLLPKTWAPEHCFYFQVLTKGTYFGITSFW